jgi:hypothetical protein
MNWKLIFQLSIFGLAMAIATVFWIPSNYEPWFWLIICLICAYLIAKKCQGKFFLNGFMVSLVNCVWITSAHIIFFQPYVANHLDDIAMTAKMPLADTPRLMMLITGLVIGILSGLVLGFFAFLASKLIKRQS